MSKILPTILLFCTLSGVVLGSLDSSKPVIAQDSSEKSRCAICEKCATKNNLKRCGKCKKRWYCSVACQIADWPAHKPKCLEWSKKSVLDAVTHLKPIQKIIAGYINTWVESHAIPSKSARIPRLAFLQNGKYLLSHDDTHVLIWNAATYTQEKALKGTNRALRNVHHSPDGNYIVSLSYDHEIYIWDARTFELLKNFTGESIAKRYPELRWRNYMVSVEGLVPLNDDKIVICFIDKIFIYSWKSDNVLEVILDRSRNMVLAPDGKHLAGASAGSFKIWDTQSLQQLVHQPDWKYSAHNTMDAIAYSPDNTYFANATAGGGTLHIRDRRTYEIVDTVLTRCAVNGLAFSPNGKYMSYSVDCHVYVYHLQKKREIYVTNYADSSSVCFSPEGSVLVIGLPTGLKIWQVPTELE